eukprot:GEMP01083861.1.p1 GENE.GEMP01083861.1~~GEMP01083861.1.p1  ORF type:complete len:160 (+),score=19.95 GEMP01083861.1:466-945(+)
MAYGLEPMRRVTYAPDITEPLGSLFEELVTGRNSQIRKLVDFLASGKTERWAGGMAQITLLVNGKSDATYPLRRRTPHLPVLVPWLQRVKFLPTASTQKVSIFHRSGCILLNIPVFDQRNRLSPPCQGPCRDRTPELLALSSVGSDISRSIFCCWWYMI